jgi:hypothetical protein
LNVSKGPFRTWVAGTKALFVTRGLWVGAARCAPGAREAGSASRTHRFGDTDGMTIGGFRLNVSKGVLQGIGT